MLTSEMLSKLSTCTSTPTGMAEPVENETKQVWNTPIGVKREQGCVLSTGTERVRNRNGFETGGAARLSPGSLFERGQCDA